MKFKIYNIIGSVISIIGILMLIYLDKSTTQIFISLLVAMFGVTLIGGAKKFKMIKKAPRITLSFVLLSTALLIAIIKIMGTEKIMEYLIIGFASIYLLGNAILWAGRMVK